MAGWHGGHQATAVPWEPCHSLPLWHQVALNTSCYSASVTHVHRLARQVFPAEQISYQPEKVPGPQSDGKTL